MSRVPFVGWSILALLSIVGCGLFSVSQGIDANWDLKNYHVYAPFAALHDRYMVDVAPAQLQTFFNPLLDYSFYFFISFFNDWPRTIAFVMGAIHGFTVVFITAIAWICLRSLGTLSLFSRVVLTALAAGIGITGACTVPLIGTTTGDVPMMVSIIGALFFVIQAIDAAAAGRPDYGRWLLVGGLLAGLGFGAKPTVGVYGLGLAAALLALPPRLLIFGVFRFGAAAAVGALVTGTWHAARLVRLFGNPLFPLMNGTFRSPWFEPFSARDERFLPKSLFEVFFYPFEWATNSTRAIASELIFRDIRIAFAITVGLVALAVWIFALMRRSATGGRPPRVVVALCLFSVVSYVAWLAYFSIYRYAGPLEVVCGPLIVLGLGAILPRWSWVPAAAVAALACYLTTIPQDCGHVPIENRYLEVKAPVLAPGTLVATAGADPVSYFFPFMGNDVVFVGLYNNLMSPAYKNRLVQRARSLVADHKGPLKVINAGFPPDVFTKALDAYGLQSDGKQCEPISSNLGDTYTICTATRRNPG